MESGGVRDIQDFDVDFNVDTKRDKVSIWTLEERSLPNLSKLYTYESQRLYLKDKIYEYPRLSQGRSKGVSGHLFVGLNLFLAFFSSN